MISTVGTSGTSHWLSQGDEVKLGHPLFLPLQKPVLAPQPEETARKVPAPAES